MHGTVVWPCVQKGWSVYLPAPLDLAPVLLVEQCFLYRLSVGAGAPGGGDVEADEKGTLKGSRHRRLRKIRGESLPPPPIG